jgi:hypothetical protein
MEVFKGSLTIRQIFQRDGNWGRYVKSKGGVVRAAVTYHVLRMLACRTPILGCHIYHCEKCQIQRVVPHSCKSSFCSSCGKARTDNWCEGLLSEILDIAYRHLTFTLPWQVRLPIQDNRKRLLNVIFREAANTILALTLGDPKPLSHKAQERMSRLGPEKRYRPGIIIVVHTFGSDLKWNVHLHIIVTCGGLSADGKHFIQAPERSLVSAKELATEWKLRVIQAIHDEEAKEPLVHRRLREDRRRRIDIKKLLGYIRNLTWHVLIGRSLVEVLDTVRYCCRYTKRPVIAEYRLKSYKDGYVSYTYKDYYNGSRTAFMKLPVMTFIDRLTQHIPEKYFRQVRHYGMFSNRRRSNDLPLARKLLNKRKRRKPKPTTWEDRRKERGEKQPLTCPKCQMPLILVAILFGAPAFIAQLLSIPVDSQIPYPCYTNAYTKYLPPNNRQALPHPRFLSHRRNRSILTKRNE